jgi:hypothetical protein
MEKLETLAPEQRAEVEDFVDFLKARRKRSRDEAGRRLGAAFKKLDALKLPPLSQDGVRSEIKAARAGRRSRDASRR